MSNLISFSFDQSPVRVIHQDGEPWFVLADVCAVLDISNVGNASARLDDDEKGIHSMDTLGGMQALTIINESGLYSLILTSRKDNAKRFKKWVTSEVLPSIRKTGQYSVQPEKPKDVAALADFGRYLMEYAERSHPNLGEKSRQVLAARVANSVFGEGTLPLPLIEEKFYTTTEIANAAGVTPQKAGKIANSRGLKVPGHGEVRLSKSNHSEKHVEQWYWSEAGKAALLTALVQ
jgi:prophage antirepressor-like protein